MQIQEADCQSSFVAMSSQYVTEFLNRSWECPALQYFSISLLFHDETMFYKSEDICPLPTCHELS